METYIINPSTKSYYDQITKKVYEDGSVYQGQFRGKDREGVGMYQYKNGDCYLGDWSNDQFQGQGINGLSTKL